MGCFSSSTGGPKSLKKLYKRGSRYFIKHKWSDQHIQTVKLEISLSNSGLFEGSKVSVHQASDPNYSILTPLGTTEQYYPGMGAFTTPNIVLKYIFGIHQYLQFSIGIGGTANDRVRTTLGDIAGALGNRKQFPVQGGILTVRLIRMENSDNEKVLCMEFDVEEEEVSSVPFEYFILVLNYRKSKWKKVFKTAEQSGKNMHFVMENLDYHELCNGDNTAKFIIQLYQARYGKIGEQATNFASFSQEGISPTLIFGSGKKKFQCRVRCQYKPPKKFWDYIETGLQIGLVIGIDYTASNMNYRKPESLHYIGGTEPNQYEQAIKQCGGILASYDTDKSYSVLGFGGVLNTQPSITNFAFNVNMQANGNISGIDNVIQAYKNSFNFLELSGPTNFAPIINLIAKDIKQQMKNGLRKSYSVFLLLTDGGVCDPEDTKDAIFKAAKQPMSIVIVGVGNSDFSQMKALDGDDNAPLRNKNGKKISRDIVQFVKFNDYKNDLARMTQQVLGEIPGQVQEYFHMYRNFS